MISQRYANACCCVLICINALLLLRSASVHSATYLEPAHLASGLLHWQTGQFSVGKVNPPLVRLWATFPLFVSGYRLEHPKVQATDPDGRRIEYANGEWMIRNHPALFQQMLFLARVTCIPFSILGAAACYIAGRFLFGNLSGLIAVLLWTGSPMVLGHGALITEDLPAASLGAWAAVLFFCWLRWMSWSMALLLGFVLGLALLTKFTLLLLLPVFVAALILHSRLYPDPKRSHRVRNAQSAFMGALVLIVVNSGYLFQGTGTRLDAFNFKSSILGNEEPSRETSGNRFRESWLGPVRVPLPSEYLLGIDLQLFEFSQMVPAYIRGSWRQQGVWYYYLYAYSIKTPLGMLALLSLACLSIGFHSHEKRVLIGIAVVLPVILFFFIASTQIGNNEHLRYCLPAYPFLFVLASSAGSEAVHLRRRIVTGLAGLCALGAFGSSLEEYPHSLSYFNSLVGGSASGPRHLLGSNVDWGQDLFLLKDWTECHPECRPLTVVYWGPIASHLIGGWDDGITHSRMLPSTNENGPHWYAVSINTLYTHGQEETKPGKFPDARLESRIGYSINVYFRPEMSRD